MANELKIKDIWTPSLQSETTANDSDKTFTVTASQEWQVCTIYVSLVTTASAGDRQLCVLFTDGSDNVIAEARAGAVQAASLTRTYVFGLGLADLASFRDTDHITMPLPVVVLPAGYKVRIYDNNAIDAAADDMTVRMMVQARTV